MGEGHQEEFYACSDIEILPFTVTHHAVLVQHTTTLPTIIFTAKHTTRDESVSAIGTAKTFDIEKEKDNPCSASYRKVTVSNREASKRKTLGENIDCIAHGPWAKLQAVTKWCRTNCFGVTVFCASSHCKCFLICDNIFW